ncbi:MAG TPA: GIY-YIG nuclease family protein [Caulobacteraceae bacterium]|jgi:hypothetical protein
MQRAERRAAIAAYKMRKAAWGVFVVRCAATGQAWVGGSRHLEPQQNSLWFSLRHGAHINRALQAAWDAHGPDGFVFEVLERLPEDLSDLRRPDELKARAAEWRATLNCSAL